MERGHRVLRIVGKGSKPALIPLISVLREVTGPDGHPAVRPLPTGVRRWRPGLAR